jgi:hypothetical protein
MPHQHLNLVNHRNLYRMIVTSLIYQDLELQFTLVDWEEVERDLTNKGRYYKTMKGLKQNNPRHRPD